MCGVSVPIPLEKNCGGIGIIRLYSAVGPRALVCVCVLTSVRLRPRNGNVATYRRGVVSGRGRRPGGSGGGAICQRRDDGAPGGARFGAPERKGGPMARGRRRRRRRQCTRRPGGAAADVARATFPVHAKRVTGYTGTCPARRQ